MAFNQQKKKYTLSKRRQALPILRKYRAYIPKIFDILIPIGKEAKWKWSLQQELAWKKTRILEFRQIVSPFRSKQGGYCHMMLFHMDWGQCCPTS